MRRSAALGSAIEDFGARLRQFEKQELRPSNHNLVSLKRFHSREVMKPIKSGLLSSSRPPTMKSAAPIVVPTAPDDDPAIGANIIQRELWPSVGGNR
jgi:hypothetical protein